MTPRQQPGRPPRGRQRIALVVIALAVAAVGVVVIVVAAMQRTTPPAAANAGVVAVSPSQHGRGPSSSVKPARSRPTAGHPRTPQSADQVATRNAPTQPSTPAPARSVPVRLDIPEIGVDASVIPEGNNSRGTIAVPLTGPDINKAMWYDHSPTPGLDGPSVIVGHITTTHGPSVFYRLSALRPGDTVQVVLADHDTATFTVNGVRTYTRSQFPSNLVYAGDLADPTLRLVTCTDFNSQSGHYAGNLVVFTHLTAFHSSAG